MLTMQMGFESKYLSVLCSGKKDVQLRVVNVLYYNTGNILNKKS